MQEFSGRSISRGISIGVVSHLYKKQIPFTTFTPDDPVAELARYHQAVVQASNRIQKKIEIAERNQSKYQADIYQSHISILQDPEIEEYIKEKILTGKINAETAIYDISEYYCKLIEDTDDCYLVSRAMDVRDVRETILAVLTDTDDSFTISLTEPSVLICNDLSPSDCNNLPREFLMGICIVEGTFVSHTAIILREIGIPSVSGVSPDMLDICDGKMAIIDGYTGTVIIDPDMEIELRYRRLRDEKYKALNNAIELAKKPATTLDGSTISVLANITKGDFGEIINAHKNGADGIGLFRTEFFFSECSKLPTEDEQFEVYNALAEDFGARPVTLRTLDIGGDKPLPYLAMAFEANPYLGIRGIRYCMKNMDLFRNQLRAMLRASANGNVRILLPMVSSYNEILAVKKIVKECVMLCKYRGFEIPEKIELGVMIEVPSAAIMSDIWAREVDFFSIGTNDLTQYTLAADRSSQTMSEYSSAFDPSVLRLIQYTCESAHKHGISVSLCGELGNDPTAIPVLVGLGIDQISSNIHSIPLVKQIIRRISKAECEDLVNKILMLDNPLDVHKFIAQNFTFPTEIM